MIYFLLMNRLYKKLLALKEEYFVFWVSLLFYLTLYFNLNNKTLLGLFFLFLLVFWRRLKDFSTALFIIYLLFLPFGKGKTFDFVLIPAYMIPAYMIDAEVPFTYGLTITFADLAFLGLFALIIKNEVINRWRIKKLRLNRNDFFLFLFLSFVFISIFFSQFQIVSFLAFLKLIRIVAIYFLVQRFLFEPRVRRLLPLVLVTLLIFQGGWASLQFLFQRPLGRSIEHYGGLFSAYGHVAAEERTFFRAQGTFEHPNTLGSFLVMFLAFTLAQIFALYPERKKKIFLASFLLGLAGLIFSASRVSWVVALLIWGLIAVFLKRYQKELIITPLIKKWLLVIFLSLALSLPFFILPRLGHLYLTLAEKGGVYYRTYLLEKAWFLAQESPLGIGLATFPAALIKKFGFFTWPTPVHNLLLEILVETGIFSLVFFLLFLIFTYKRFFLNLAKLKNNQEFFLKVGAFCASLGFLGVAQFYPFFWASNLFEFFWLFLGIMLYNT